MAELDYAFLADYARVDPTGTLTSVGASFTHVQVDGLPAQRLLSVAGRVRSQVEAEPVALRVTIKTPGDEIQLSFDAQLQVGANARPYGDGRVGLLFAVALVVPLPRAGLYEVQISLDGVLRRELKFDVEIGQQPG